MSKSTAVKASGAIKIARTVVNRAAKLARHMKSHPNDAQSETRFKPTTVRKKPHTRGNFKQAKFLVCDAAGNGRLDAHSFMQSQPVNA